METQEELKDSFYSHFKRIIHYHMVPEESTVYDYAMFVLQLEEFMIHPRIINQFNLAFEKLQKEKGLSFPYFHKEIIDFIESRTKNY